MSGVQRRSSKEIAYSDLTAESQSGDDDLENDGVGLVVNENGDNRSRSRKYVVSGSPGGLSKRLPSWCRPSRLSRTEKICLVVGLVAIVAILVVFIVVVIVARPSGGAVPAPSSSGDGGDHGNDGGGGNHTGSGGDNNGGSDAQIQWANIRLQSAVVPETYDIHMSVNLDTFLVTGTVNILCSVKNSTDYVAVHARDMSFGNHHVMRDGAEVKHKAVLYPDNDFFVFDLASTLTPGPVNLHIEFNYTLRESLAGFYKSSYINSSGDKVYLGTTQFEPTDARLAFPCFDEPALKANFTMHMTHQARYRAWFNMPLINRSEETSDGFVTSHFQTSVKMSTYLVAFIVSDFECVNDTIPSTSGRDIVIQVCSNPTVVEHTHYALKVAKDVVMFYEREFGVSYPLPKQDLFAIPDFSAGAMENWGLITYRETAVLYDEATNPATSKERVAVVVAHELAHQWFGNLVTMAWWDGLWLNEGFASFMEYIGANYTEPSFNMLEQFVADDMVTALQLDGLSESHPILQVVNHPSEINSLFDSISYSKGASIIRMLKNFIGADAFRSGVTLYLNQHRYGNAETYQLWEALQEESWAYILGGLIIYTIERIVRFARSFRKVVVIKVVEHPSKTIEIQMRSRGFYAEAGQYVFINVPSVAFFEWHPFTLTSAPEEDYFSVHIRVVGDWTQKLAKQLGVGRQDFQQSWELPKIAIDGPFGTASEDVFSHEVGLLVGAGIGVTPFASILKSIFYKLTQEGSNLSLKKVYFYWICPNPDSFEWFADLLNSVEQQMQEKGLSDFLDTHIYLTRGWKDNQAFAIMLREGDDRDAITGLQAKTHFGRPDWPNIFDEISLSHRHTSVGVFFCGPPVLSHNLHRYCNEYTKKGGERARFFYNKENF